jgi:hypothetical protein
VPTSAPLYTLYYFVITKYILLLLHFIHLVGFTIGIYYDTQTNECQKYLRHRHWPSLFLSAHVLKYPLVHIYFSPCLESVCTHVVTVFSFLFYHCHYCHLCMHFTRRFSVCREHQPGVSLPPTCCFNNSQSALLIAKFSTMVISAVQGTGNSPAGATHTRSSRPQILHNPFKCSGSHTSHVLPMEDVRRKLICFCLEQTLS